MMQENSILALCALFEDHGAERGFKHKQIQAIQEALREGDLSDALNMVQEVRWPEVSAILFAAMRGQETDISAIEAIRSSFTSQDKEAKVSTEPQPVREHLIDKVKAISAPLLQQLQESQLPSTYQTQMMHALIQAYPQTRAEMVEKIQAFLKFTRDHGAFGEEMTDAYGALIQWAQERLQECQRHEANLVHKDVVEDEQGQKQRADLAREAMRRREERAESEVGLRAHQEQVDAHLKACEADVEKAMLELRQARLETYEAKHAAAVVVPGRSPATQEKKSPWAWISWLKF